MGFFLLLMLAFLVLFDSRIREALGSAVGAVFFPVFGFGYHYPVLTIFIGGSIVIIISAVIRHFTTDWIEMAKSQERASSFQKKYREALKSQNKYQIKKMQQMQQEMMREQSQVSMRQMRIMPITLLVFVPVFAWLWSFLEESLRYYFDVPWHLHVFYFDSIVFPNWILLYMLLSIPLTQLIQYALRWKCIQKSLQ